MKKKKKSGGGGGNWMDTYGDLVTLLMCFFVLLYSMAPTEEAEKRQQMAESFRRINFFQALSSPGQGTGMEYNPKETNTPTEVSKETVTQSLQKVKESIEEYASQNGMVDQITVSQGADYVFITFENAVFFEGDSYEVSAKGKEVLDVLAESIRPEGGMVDEIRVMGHTSQAKVDIPNDPKNDRFLSVERAASVTVYLQNKNIVDPDRLVSIGYGQWRPIAGFKTSADRAKNRRVEIMITGISPNGVKSSVDQYFTTRTGDGEGKE